MNWLRRFLSYEIKLAITVGNIIAVMVIVTIVNLLRTNPPVWWFAVLGVALVVAERLAAGVWKRIRRHRMAS